MPRTSNFGNELTDNFVGEWSLVCKSEGINNMVPDDCNIKPVYYQFNNDSTYRWSNDEHFKIYSGGSWDVREDKMIFEQGTYIHYTLKNDTLIFIGDSAFSFLIRN